MRRTSQTGRARFAQDPKTRRERDVFYRDLRARNQAEFQIWKLRMCPWRAAKESKEVMKNLKIPPQLRAHLQAQKDQASQRDIEQAKERERIFCAWLNTARFKLRKEGPKPGSGVRSIMTQMESPIISPEDAGKPQNEMMRVRFNLEEHRCILHPEHQYEFWRSDLAGDAGTPPVCPACMDGIGAQPLQVYMQRRGWKYNLIRDEWTAEEIVITGQVLNQPDHTALYTIALYEGRLVEAVILELMPPAAAGVPLALLLTTEEHRHIVRAEGNSQSRTSGFKALRKMLEMGFSDEVIRLVAWRNVQISIVTPALGEKLGRAQRVIEGNLCQMSGRVINGACAPGESTPLRNKMLCGMCQSEVNLLEFGIVEPHLSNQFRPAG
jgi:hypothetical protein